MLVLLSCGEEGARKDDDLITSVTLMLSECCLDLLPQYFAFYVFSLVECVDPECLACPKLRYYLDWLQLYRALLFQEMCLPKSWYYLLLHCTDLIPLLTKTDLAIHF